MFFGRNQQPTPRISLGVSEPVAFPSLGDGSKKILIVDDDLVILKALSLTLRSNGYQILTATDAGEAISQVNHEKPDLLIVDVFLGIDPVGCGALGWDGFQLARWIHTLNCHAPVIIMSGTEQPGYRQQSIASGARGFLTKPIDGGILLKMIASLLPGKQRAGLNGMVTSRIPLSP